MGALGVKRPPLRRRKRGGHKGLKSPVKRGGRTGLKEPRVCRERERIISEGIGRGKERFGRVYPKVIR